MILAQLLALAVEMMLAQLVMLLKLAQRLAPAAWHTHYPNAAVTWIAIHNGYICLYRSNATLEICVAYSLPLLLLLLRLCNNLSTYINSYTARNWHICLDCLDAISTVLATCEYHILRTLLVLWDNYNCGALTYYVAILNCYTTRCKGFWYTDRHQ